MMIGTDSHTPNAGGLGMVAIGVGGADAVDVMTGYPFNVRWPKLIGVHLTGELSGWSRPEGHHPQGRRDPHRQGRHRRHRRVLRPRRHRRSRCTGKATICNMGAEIGATTSLFAYDDAMARYLKSTGREAIVDAADAVAHDLRADDEVLADPGRFFDQVIEIDLSTLEPLINGRHTPDLARPVVEARRRGPRQRLADRDQRRPRRLVHQLVATRTSPGPPASTRQDAAAGLTCKTELMITPGSEQVRATIERDGLLADFERIGATVLANACGPCIGQWARPDEDEGDANTIVTSYNRNFPKRNDGFASTLAFVTSPETVVALALAGTVEFDPINDTLTNDAGEEVKLAVPVGEELPAQGFTPGESGFIAPPADAAGVEVVVSPTSDRLQLLEPFAPWDGNDYIDLPVLVKASGKCTTDHISAAGPVAQVPRPPREHQRQPLPRRHQRLHRRGRRGQGPARRRDQVVPRHRQALPRGRLGWVAIGDENYGEGSSASTPPWSPASAAPRRSSAAASPASPRPTSRSRACCRLTFADPPTTTRSARTTASPSSAWPTWPPTSRCSARSTRPTARPIDFTRSRR